MNNPLPFEERHRCKSCGNCQRFIALRVPKENTLSSALVIQEQGRLYIVKGSIEQVYGAVPEVWKGGQVVRMHCANCMKKMTDTPVNPPYTTFDRIEKEYWEVKELGG